jgi:hypothetical protein
MKKFEKYKIEGKCIEKLHSYMLEIARQKGRNYQKNIQFAGISRILFEELLNLNFFIRIKIKAVSIV